MPPAFEAARAEGWTYGGLLRRGLDDVLDDEGRPLAERRAASAVKRGVTITLRACPYVDAREGKPMNVSALAQISRHFDTVLDDVAGFHAALDERAPSWERVFTVVVDQLAAPVLFLLRARSAAAVPARLSVAHKLAAGYFGVVRALLTSAASGRALSVSADSLLSFAHETRAFVGASEACAGPPPMIARATDVFVSGRGGGTPLVDPCRVAVATLFRQQIQLGVAWEQFDATIAREVLDVLGATRPRTELYRRRLEEARGALSATEPPVPGAAASALPSDLDPNRADALRAAFAGEGDRAQDVAETVAWLPETGAGAIVFGRTGERGRLLDMLATYLSTYATVIEVLVALERRLRHAVGAGDDGGPFSLDGIVLPSPKALHWMETALGVRASCPATARPEVSLVALPTPTITTGSSVDSSDRR